RLGSRAALPAQRALLGLRPRELALPRFGHPAFGQRLKPPLHRSVAIPFGSTDLGYDAWSGLDHRHRDDIARLVKHLRHAEFSSNDGCHHETPVIRES